MDSIWSSQQNGSTTDNQIEPSSSCTLSIAEMIAQTANEFISEQVLPGYTYSSEYNMYHNSETGYYYDTNTFLFYHPFSQCYYRYNQHSNIYETIPTQPAADPLKWIKKKNKKRAKEVLEREEGDLDQMQVDVLECLFEVVDKCAFLAGDFATGEKERRMRKIGKRRAKGIERIFKMARGAANIGSEEYPDIPEIMSHPAGSRSMRKNSQLELRDMVTSSDSSENSEAEAEELRRWQVEEESSRHGACIRLIETNCSGVSAPILHIITITGATVGFGTGADVQLSGSSPTNTPVIFAITYVQHEKEPRNSYYQAEFHVAQIKFNDIPVRIGSIQKLKHHDKISFGPYVLILHLHNGLNTCPGCEPGLFPASQLKQAEIRTKPKSRDAQRRHNNRLMKQQYGLLNEDEDFGQSRIKYTDRAHKRRKEELKVSYKPTPKNAVGGIYANCLAAPKPGTSTDSVQLRVQEEEPVDKALGKSNSKGLQLLKGMGWKEGQGLGRNQQGIQEPIVSTLKSNRAGFGSETTTSAATAKVGKISIQLKSKSQMEKESILEKTRKRYEQVNQPK